MLSLSQSGPCHKIPNIGRMYKTTNNNIYGSIKSFLKHQEIVGLHSSKLSSLGGNHESGMYLYLSGLSLSRSKYSLVIRSSMCFLMALTSGCSIDRPIRSYMDGEHVPVAHILNKSMRPQFSRHRREQHVVWMYLVGSMWHLHTCQLVSTIISLHKATC